MAPMHGAKLAQRQWLEVVFFLANLAMVSMHVQYRM